MRKQGQISPWSLPHTISSICCGSGTAHNATSLRYQGGKRQVNERRTPCEQAVIPFRSRQFVQNPCSAVRRKGEFKTEGETFVWRPWPSKWNRAPARRIGGAKAM